MIAVKLKYSSKLEAEELMLEEVESFLEDAGIDFLQSRPILVSISEAFTNALTHGNKKNPEKSIQIIIRVDVSTIEVEVTDEGQGAIKVITARKPVGEFAESGRGINIIEHYAKETKLSELESGGLKVFMVFSRSKQGKRESQIQLSMEDNDGNQFE